MSRSRVDRTDGNCTECGVYISIIIGNAYLQVNGSIQKRCKRCANKKRKALRYGIEVENLSNEEFYGKEVCDICGEKEKTVAKGRVINLSIDHDHETGRIRGVLCRRCNTVLGVVKDSPSLLRDMAEYLDRYNRQDEDLMRGVAEYCDGTPQVGDFGV